MIKLDTMPATAATKLPAELFDGSAWQVTPEEFGFKTVTALRNAIRRQAKKRDDVKEVQTTLVGDAALAVQVELVVRAVPADDATPPVEGDTAA